MAAIRFGIITVSDTCYVDPTKDRSGPNLEEAVKSAFADACILFKEIVPDNKETIQYALLEKCTETSCCDVVLVTGGTGFAPRDVTPEATKSVITKEAPGLSYAMISKSLEITDMAALSRMVCGIRNHTLIINLPGSAKASVECFGFIKNTLPHAVDLIRNDEMSVKKTHRIIQGETSTKSPVSPSKVKIQIAFRSRHSEYPMCSVEDALNVILESCKSMTTKTEDIDVSNSINRILAEDIAATDNLPPFPASIKDGYAALSSDGTGLRRVRDVVAAGDSAYVEPLRTGEVIRVSTGAGVPAGADAVVQVEDTELCKASEDGSKEVEIKINIAPKPGQDIRPIGSDVKKGSIVLKKGERIFIGHVGVFASLGINKVKVFKRPTIGVLSTGNELQEPSEPLKPYHIRDSNKSTLLSLLKYYNFEATDCGIAKDNPDSVKESFTYALKGHDVVITTGGVSMGEFDVVKKVLEVDFDARIHFGRVNMKPGKPTTFASCILDGKQKLIFSLPGNPVSAVVTGILFVLPALRTMVNESKIFLPTVRARLVDHKSSLDARPEYVRVHLQLSEDGQLVARNTGDQISSRLNSFIGANGLLVLPGRGEYSGSLETNLFDVILIDFFAGGF